MHYSAWLHRDTSCAEPRGLETREPVSRVLLAAFLLWPVMCLIFWFGDRTALDMPFPVVLILGGFWPAIIVAATIILWIRDQGQDRLRQPAESNNMQKDKKDTPAFFDEW